MSEDQSLLYIDSSQIPSGGEGLYTRVDIMMGEKICDFGGELIGSHAFENILDAVKRGEYDMEAANYYVSLSSGLILDSSKSDCYARYANDAEGFKKLKGFTNNTKIVEGDDKLSAFLVAIKLIPAGSEILTSYGKSYWKGFSNKN